MSAFELPSGRICLTILSVDQAELARQYYLENREHLGPWEPARDEQFYCLEAVTARIRNSEAEFRSGLSCHFAIIERESGRMIGACNFSNIVRGVFQACHLGFAIADSHQGRGYAYEAVRAGIDYMFASVGLHRIMANHLPHNTRSERLLQRLGFQREGYAKSYLKIAGVWQDHVLNSLVNPGDE